MHREKRRIQPSAIPDWLIGLLIAIVIVAGVAVYLRSVGAGDDPAFESDTTESRSSAASFALWNGSAAMLTDPYGPLVVDF